MDKPKHGMMKSSVAKRVTIDRTIKPLVVNTKSICDKVQQEREDDYNRIAKGCGAKHGMS